MRIKQSKTRVTIYSDGYPRSDYGYAVIRNGRIIKLGDERGREGGIYWRRNLSKQPLESLKKEATDLVGCWGRKFYSEILSHAYNDSKSLPSPDVATMRFKNQLIKLKRTEIRMKEKAIRRLKDELKEIKNR